MYIDEFAESVCDAFAVENDDFSIKAKCTTLMLHSRDLEYEMIVMIMIRIKSWWALTFACNIHWVKVILRRLEGY